MSWRWAAKENWVHAIADPEIADWYEKRKRPLDSRLYINWVDGRPCHRNTASGVTRRKTHTRPFNVNTWSFSVKAGDPIPYTKLSKGRTDDGKVHLYGLPPIDPNTLLPVYGLPPIDLDMLVPDADDVFDDEIHSRPNDGCWQGTPTDYDGDEIALTCKHSISWEATQRYGGLRDHELLAAKQIRRVMRELSDEEWLMLVNYLSDEPSDLTTVRVALDKVAALFGYPITYKESEMYSLKDIRTKHGKRFSNYFIESLIAQDRFPKPIRLSNRRGSRRLWPADAVDQAIKRLGM